MIDLKRVVERLHGPGYTRLGRMRVIGYLRGLELSRGVKRMRWERKMKRKGLKSKATKLRTSEKSCCRLTLEQHRGHEEYCREGKESITSVYIEQKNRTRANVIALKIFGDA